MAQKHDHGPSAGYAPGADPIAQKLFGMRVGRKKLSGRTPADPKPMVGAHGLARWRDHGRAGLLLAGIRLGVLDSSREPVGRRAQFRTWKALAVAVERARRALDS